MWNWENNCILRNELIILQSLTMSLMNVKILLNLFDNQYQM